MVLRVHALKCGDASLVLCLNCLLHGVGVGPMAVLHTVAIRSAFLMAWGGRVSPICAGTWWTCVFALCKGDYGRAIRGMVQMCCDMAWKQGSYLRSSTIATTL